MRRNEDRNHLLRRYNSEAFIEHIASARTEADLKHVPYTADEAARYVLPSTSYALALRGVFIRPVIGTDIWDLFRTDLTHIKEA